MSLRVESKRPDGQSIDSGRFTQSTLDALSAHLCVLDENGVILATNKAWSNFSEANPPTDQQTKIGSNYLAVCDETTGRDAVDAATFATGIRSVISGECDFFSMEYPCHSPTEKRWFVGRVTRFFDCSNVRVVVVHEDITGRREIQDRLLGSEQRYRRLFETAKDGILILEARTGKIEDVNPYLIEMLGYTHADFLGKELWEIGLFQDIASNKAAFRKLQNKGYIRYENLPLETKGGRSIWVEFVSNTYDVQGKKVIQCNIRDITARKQGENALRDSEEHYRSLFENMLDGVAYCQMLFDHERPNDFIYVAVNAAFGTLTGLKDVVGKKASDVIPGIQADDPGLFEIYGRVVRTGIPEMFETYVQSLQKWFQTSVYRPAPDHFVAIFDVITVRKRAEQALRDSEERFRQLAENINEVFWIISPKDKQVLYISPAFEKIWGRTCESLCASPETWLDAIHPDDQERIRQAVMTKQEYGKYDEVYRILRPDGALRWIHDRAYPLRNAAGEVFRIVGTASDITTTRKLEEQLRQTQKMDAIGQLAGGVAHDFNNQLNIIMGYAAMLVDQLNDSKLKRYAENILTSTQRSADLTMKLLAFSRKGQFQAVPLSIHKMLNETIEMIERTIDKRVVVKQSLKANPDVIVGDPSQIQNAFLNLAVNARDAMPKGGQLIFETKNVFLDSESLIKCGGGALPGHYIKVSLSDTGTGMSDEVKRHLFEPFYTTKPVGKGTGMGLASVFGTVKNHNGFIDVYSEIDHGTTFKLFLPLAEQMVVSRATTTVLPKKTRKLRILLVEDEEILREMFVEMLRSGGHEIVEAGNGRQALDWYRKDWRNIDLVVLDMIMPEMDGPDAFRAMKKINPHIKALLATGFSLNTEVQAALDEGVLGFIQKPFMPNDVLDLIAKVMNAD